MELHRVQPRRKGDTAHDEVAAQQRSRMAIHQHLPVRIIFVVQQQHRRGFDVRLQHQVLRGVAYEHDRAGALIGCACGRGRQVCGDQHRFAGVEAGTDQRRERLRVIGLRDPLGIKSSPWERAGKLDHSILPVGGDDRGQFLQLARLGDARFGTIFKNCTLQNWRQTEVCLTTSILNSKFIIFIFWHGSCTIYLQ